MKPLTRASRPWSKIPAWIARGDKLVALLPGGRFSGRSIAMVRLVTCIAVSSRQQDAFQIETPLWRLAEAMKLSLPSVRAAIREAEKLNLVKFTRGSGNRCSRIELIQGPEKTQTYFVIPNDRFDAICQLGKKSEISLVAIKLYLLMLSRRTNTECSVAIGYDKLRDGTGVQKDQIRSGLSLLAINQLVDVDQETSLRRPGAHNLYRLRGNFGTKAGDTQARRITEGFVAP